MKHYHNPPARARSGAGPTLPFPHAVQADLCQIPGLAAVVCRNFTERDIERATAIRLRVFKRDPDDNSLLATAALFALEQRLFVMDVLPAARHDADDGATIVLSPSEYHVVVNAVVDFAFDQQIPLVYFPTTPTLACPGAVPYDSVDRWFEARLRRAVTKHPHLRVVTDLKGLIRLEPDGTAQTKGASVCLIHTFDDEGNGTRSDRPQHVLAAVTAAAARRHVSLTLCLPERMLHDAALLAGSHAVAYRGTAQPGSFLLDLPRLRWISSTIAGYYPPGRVAVPEIADRTLSYYDIGWLLQSPTDGALPFTTHRQGLVRFSVSLDDADLATQGLDRWAARAEAIASTNPACLLELSAATSDRWLPGYETLLAGLQRLRPLRSCEEVMVEALAGVNGPHGLPASSRGSGEH